jgi:flagellar biosynthetic protein FlhB
MDMSELSSERIHPASPRRRQLAREEGRVARSHDLPVALVLLTGLLVLLYFGSSMVQVLGDYARHQFDGQAWLGTDSDLALQSWRSIMRAFGRVVAPVLGVVLAVAVIGNIGQTGLMVVPNRLLPDISRINPAAGIRRLCSLDSVMRLSWALLKILAVVGIAIWIVWQQRARLLTLGTLPPAAVVVAVAEVALWTCLKIAGLLLVLGVADYGLQRWRHERSLRMTTEELREELRNQQGDPSLAGRRSQVRRGLALTRLRNAASRADLVIAHGTSLAVALRYNPSANAAPVVVAKGMGEAGSGICAVATEKGIPIKQQQSLALDLCRKVPVGKTIGSEHYESVARLWQSSPGRVAGG